MTAYHMEALRKAEKFNEKQIFRWPDGECNISTGETEIYRFRGNDNKSLDQ